MKLVRYGSFGHEKPGLLDDMGVVRDLSSFVEDVDANCLRPEMLRRLSELKPEDLPLAPTGSRLGAPVAGVGKVIAIGLNYADHAREAQLPIPSEPVVFIKAVTAICGPNDDVIMPPNSTKCDWEIELAMVIGQITRHIDGANALEYVAGYLLANDISEREWQLERGGTWDKGKGFDTFLPIGPWLVTRDEIGDPQALELRLDVNGHRFQSGSTRNMIFDCAAIIAYVSRLMTLLPGDIIITGTPPGVGTGIKPQPVFLKDGDVMRLGITGLGQQVQRVRSFDRSALPDFQCD